MEVIESLENSKIKLAVKLHAKKHRDKENLFLAEGIRLVEMAVKSDWTIRFCIVTEKAASIPRVQSIINEAEEKDVPVYSVNERIYEKACGTVTPQGILAVMKKKTYDLSDIAAKNELILVMDGVQDPGNIGAMIRTADAAGLGGIAALAGSVDVYSEKVVRSSMGSLFNIPMVTGITPEEFVNYAHENGIRMLVTALDNRAKLHYNANYDGACALVFGNEGNGVSDTVLKAADETIFIPMRGGAESLNVSTAASVVVYEALRHRVYSEKD